VPSPAGRRWYDAHASHCLPLVMAGQLGWTALSSIAIDTVWDGGPTPRGVRFRRGLPRRVPGFAVSSWFGKGIVTVWLGIHFRTSPGIDLLVKAPPNAPKDGVSVLEGLVETDWLDARFSINLKLTRPGLPVRWEAGEPLCQLVPYPRGWLERFRLETVTEGPDHAVEMAAIDRWHADRSAQVAAHHRGEGPPYDQQYRLGRRHDGGLAPSTHRRKLRVPTFPGLPPAPREL
jgi:hypothetical protein